MLNIFNKLRKARELLDMTQKEVTNYLHWPDNSNLSKIETGKVKFLPTDYLQFLIDKKIDLNSIYDQNCFEVRFLEKNTDLSIVAEDKQPYLSNVKNSQDFLRIIEMQTETIKSQQQEIKRLNDQLGNADTQTKVG